ncbi:hypothetical protein Pst134EA_031720 [Puccinia striiformis f. sp. tritici]|uniref:uncharacterized protein n=1 Tax=Puccinia striiformis f. sp. tritici TaxID=168172 RepID=UPI00200730FE|nr:uncharacterized protein Pst134EA_031720 [Puccinia striiformis f. sp. tritici]KAH9445189.1 hypothetical protein Pst134EA_031720 [Puccinia striiformis f. sp. tritici]KAH9451230.1 hypothetical protein Pst134EB_018718 [Puccinia striiformis f. sp. tritici]KAI9625937.1 hypothetical protein KEM48_010637 [Puccinia striiformis f. sp. tritici PST-130]
MISGGGSTELYAQQRIYVREISVSRSDRFQVEAGRVRSEAKPLKAKTDAHEGCLRPTDRPRRPANRSRRFYQGNSASYRSKMSSITRKTTQAARRMTIAFPLRRTFVSSSSIKKDFVQELYLRELKSYKPSTQSLQGLQTQVRDFTMPAAPAAPEVPSAQDIAQEMQSWDSASLVNNQAPSSDTAEVDVNGQSADEFLAFLERDHPPPAAH